MKKALALLLVLVMVFALVACGEAKTDDKKDTETKTDDTGKKEEGKKDEGKESHKIGIVVFQDDMFMQMWTAGAVKAAEEYGWEYNASNYKSDPAELANLLQTYIDQKYDAVVLQCDQMETASIYVQKSKENGVPVGCGGALTEDEMKYYNAYCTTDPELGTGASVAAVKYIQDNNISDVKIGVVGFHDQSALYSDMRRDSFLKGLKDAGIEYTVIDEQDAHMQDTAITACSDMLTAHPEINVIYACNDGATVGCTMAVKNLGKTDSIVVFGCDASEQIMNLLMDDTYSLIGTCAQDAYGTAYDLTIAMMDCVLGKENKMIGAATVVPGSPLNDYDTAACDAYVASIKEIMG